MVVTRSLGSRDRSYSMQRSWPFEESYCGHASTLKTSDSARLTSLRNIRSQLYNKTSISYSDERIETTCPPFRAGIPKSQIAKTKSTQSQNHKPHHCKTRKRRQRQRLPNRIRNLPSISVIKVPSGSTRHISPGAVITKSGRAHYRGW